MQTFYEKLPLSLLDVPYGDLFTDQTLLLDIETTGLKPSWCWVYLIGSIRRMGDHLLLSQLIAETQAEEANILRHFLHDLDDTQRILTWRGNRFDIPFLQERCEKCGLSFQPAAFDLQDLSETAKRVPNIYPTADRGLWSTAEFLGRPHPDGRPELISGQKKVETHKAYLASKDPALMDSLRQANRENLLDTLASLSIRQFEGLLHTSVSIRKAEADQGDLLFEGSLPFTLPAAIRLRYCGVYMILDGDRIRGSIELKKGQFYYELSDPSRYVYLTDEGVLLPKALAKTVDASRRRKATQEDCRVFKEGTFVQVDPTYTFSVPPRPFRSETAPKALYAELPDEAHLPSFLEEYLPQILHDAVQKRL